MKMPRQINSASPRSSATAIVRHPCGPTADRADGRRLRPGGIVRADHQQHQCWSARSQSHHRSEPNRIFTTRPISTVVTRCRPRAVAPRLPRPAIRTAMPGSPPRTAAPGPDRRYVAREVVIEIAGTPSDADADALARRHRLTRVQFQACRWSTGHCFAGASPTPIRWRAW